MYGCPLSCIYPPIDSHPWKLSKIVADCSLFLISPCMSYFPLQYTFPFMKTPIFQYNSMYDTWQIPNILQVTCKFPDGCPEAEKEAVLGYRKVTHRTVHTQCTWMENALTLCKEVTPQHNCMYI